MLDNKISSLERWQEAMINFVPPVTGGLPEHRMGVHWIADQVRESDKDYMRKLRPPVTKIVNPSRDRVAEAFSWTDPLGHVALRYHPISEQQAELERDPVGLAKAHAAYWISQLNTTYKEFTRSKLYVMGINEPTIHTTEQAKRVALYTEVWLHELRPHSIRSYVFNFSVGWPREVDGRIVWDEFLYLEPLINATNSFGCVHEYWYPKVTSGWNSYGNRISRCPMKIRFVIGECGYTRQLAELPQPWGWNGNISAGDYARQLWEYHDLVDPNRVFAILPFTTSFGGSEWASKDTGPAHADILAQRKKFAWSVPWPKFEGVTPEPPPVEKQYKLVWPKLPRITQWYGKPHSGLDAAMVTGTPLYAMWDGVVAMVDTDTQNPNGGYGLYIRITHEDLNFDCFFAHCSEVKVKIGDRVQRGQLVALSGNTGNSTGPHLHWEIRLRERMSDGKLDGYRANVGPFTRGQVDPLGFVWALDALYGHEEK